jgi:hypothetical protein
LNVRLEQPVSPLFGPVDIADAADERGGLIEEPIVRRRHPTRTEERASEQTGEVGITVLERSGRDGIGHYEGFRAEAGSVHDDYLLRV